MNWYKKAQKIPTMENITWAIDKILVETDEISLEDLMQISQGQREQQYALPKAAQVKTKNKPIRGISPKTKNTRRSKKSKVFELFEQGTTILDISKQLGISSEKVRSWIESRFPKKTDRDKYLKYKHEKNILDTTEEMSQEMMSDFNVPDIGPKHIASVLNIDPKFISKTLKKHNINLLHLVSERSKIIVANIEQISKELPPGFKASDIISEFKKKYNFILSQNKAYSTMKLNNLGEKNKTDPNTIFQAFTTYMSRMIKGGRGIFKTQPEKLPIYIDRFFH